MTDSSRKVNLGAEFDPTGVKRGTDQAKEAVRSLAQDAQRQGQAAAQQQQRERPDHPADNLDLLRRLAKQLLHRSRNSRVIACRRVASKSFSCLLQHVQRILGSSFLAS